MSLEKQHIFNKPQKWKLEELEVDLEIAFILWSSRHKKQQQVQMQELCNNAISYFMVLACTINKIMISGEKCHYKLEI